MEEVTENPDFQINMKSDEVEEFSEFWQNQCYKLYSSIKKSLPEGLIEHTVKEGEEGDRLDIIDLYSMLVVSGVTLKIFHDVVLDLIKSWLKYRSKAQIILGCEKDPQIIIDNLSLPELEKFLQKNQHLKICEALKLFRDSKK